MPEVMASATHDGHTVEVKRDEPLSVGNGMPFTYVHVDGQFMGEVTGGRREDDGSLLGIPSGYPTSSRWKSGLRSRRVTSRGPQPTYGAIS